MITVATVLWDANRHSQAFSRGYDEDWANRLHRSFAKHLTQPFRFVVFTDRQREFSEGVEQERLRTAIPDYGCCVEPFRLGVPMIFVGLDTVVVGNIDHLADWCMTSKGLAMPRHPYRPEAINGVVLTSGQPEIARDWAGENDMEWMRRFPHALLDSLWPGQVVSYKAHVRGRGLPDDARIVYFHGEPKAPALMNEAFVRENWA